MLVTWLLTESRTWIPDTFGSREREVADPLHMCPANHERVPLNYPCSLDWGSSICFYFLGQTVNHLYVTEIKINTTHWTLNQNANPRLTSLSRSDTEVIQQALIMPKINALVEIMSINHRFWWCGCSCSSTGWQPKLSWWPGDLCLRVLKS